MEENTIDNTFRYFIEIPPYSLECPLHPTESQNILFHLLRTTGTVNRKILRLGKDRIKGDEQL